MRRHILIKNPFTGLLPERREANYLISSPEDIGKGIFLYMKLTIPLFFLMLAGCSINDNKEIIVDENYPSIYPDYVNVTIPCNIAPLNFKITGECRKVDVTLAGKSSSIKIQSGYKIKIPIKKWKQLLEEQKNDSVTVKVTARLNRGWVSFKPFSFYVSSDKIDPFLSYRLIEPGYEVWNKLQICQMNLENSNEKVIIDNNLLDRGCVNCHIFSEQDASRSFFHLRNSNGGTMIQENGEFRKIKTSTDSTISSCVYGNWHQNGRFIAFSTNVIIPGFHSINNLRLEVYDTISDVVILDIKKNEIITNNVISDDSRFETFPVFSPDGMKLYFCSAPEIKMPENYQSVKYSLCSVSFNPETGTPGTDVDTLISSIRTGKTLSQPRPSPDGKYILFTSFDYGNFPVWHKEADLYLLKLSDLSVDKMTLVNSDNADSYHSWSSNSRWFVFASKREDGMYGKPYFVHVDEDGKCGKPFLMPQKNPDFYDFFMKSYNIPELSKERVPFNPAGVRSAYKKLRGEVVNFASR